MTDTTRCPACQLVQLKAPTCKQCHTLIPEFTDTFVPHLHVSRPWWASFHLSPNTRRSSSWALVLLALVSLLTYLVMYGPAIDFH